MRFLILTAVLLAGCQSTPEPEITVEQIGWGNCQPISNLDPYEPPVLCEVIPVRVTVCERKETVETLMESYFDHSINAADFFLWLQTQGCEMQGPIMVVEIDDHAYEGDRRSDKKPGAAQAVKVQTIAGEHFWHGYMYSLRGEPI